MGIDWKRHISEEEAVVHWCDTAYMPVVNVIRDTNILKEFPGKTEADLYLWVLDHQRFLAEEGETLQPLETAARAFVDEEVKKPARKYVPIKAERGSNPRCHCEERSDEAIPSSQQEIASRRTLAMTGSKETI